MLPVTQPHQGTRATTPRELSDSIPSSRRVPTTSPTTTSNPLTTLAGLRDLRDSIALLGRKGHDIFLTENLSTALDWHCVTHRSARAVKPYRSTRFGRPISKIHQVHTTPKSSNMLSAQYIAQACRVATQVVLDTLDYFHRTI